MIPAVAVYVLAALLVVYVFRTVRQWYGLRQFGGPWAAGWTRLWHFKTTSQGRMHLVFTELNDKYGSTVRIAPHMLITNDPELLKKMNAVRSPYTRSEWYKALRLHPDLDNITSITDEAHHANIRSRMAPGYSGRENSHVEQDVDEKLQGLIDLITKSYVSTEDQYRPVEMSALSSFFTLDVISQIAFGHEFGFITTNTDPFGYIDNLKEFLPAIMLFGSFIELTRILQLPFMKAIMPKSTDKRGLGKVMGFAKERVDERFGDKPIVRKDMLGSFINRGLSQQELESETLTQITAGSDSTASGLRMALHFIATSPPVQARLLAETRAAIKAGKISRPIIKDSEARSMPYLQACIKESLRIYPPVTSPLPKQVPPEGATIDGKFAPGGTWIAQNPWGMQRRKDVYGVDVEVFRPERWLPKDNSPAEKARLAKMTDTLGLIFGYGRFGCLGRGVATMELNKGVIEVLLRFVLQPVHLCRPFQEQALGFYVHENMWYRITERDESDESGAAISLPQMGEVDALPGAFEE